LIGRPNLIIYAVQSGLKSLVYTFPDGSDEVIMTHFCPLRTNAIQGRV